MGLLHSTKTDIEHSIEDNLGRYCPKTAEMAKRKVAPPGVETRVSGLSCPVCLRLDDL